MFGRTHGFRPRVAIAGTVVLVGAGIAALSPAPAGAAALAPTTTADGGGGSGSLRDVIENNATDAAGDTVTLTSGATYTLTCADGGDINHGSATPLTILTPAGQPPATIAMESGCDERLLETGTEALTINNVVFTLGRSGATTGGACSDDTDGGALCSDGSVTVIDSSFVNNATSDDGGAIKMRAGAGTLTAIRSTFSGNCSENEGGVTEVEGSASFTNSTLTNNTSNEASALDMDNGTLTLVYSDVVGNIFDPVVNCNIPSALSVTPKQPEPGDHGARAQVLSSQPSNVDPDSRSGLVSFGSVVALPQVGPSVIGAPINCDLDTPTPFPTTSNGFNFSDDATCGFTNTATGDRQSAGDPGLGALANNGGFTQTLLPSATSPLLNFIPIASCQADGAAGVTTDQRGVSRPQGTGCEIGSVEVVVAILSARFTG